MNSTDLTRSTGRGGTNYRYQYRYATPTEVGPRQPLQTEFWVPKGRKGGRWVAQHALPAGHDASLYARTWRRVFPHHSHADKLAHSIAMRAVASDRPREKVCEEYCLWARSAGLANVTAFRGDKVSIGAANAVYAYYHAPVLVEVSYFIGDAPTPEIEE